MNEISKKINLNSLLKKLLGERLEILEKKNEDELNSLNYLNIDSKEIINFLEKNLSFQNQNIENKIYEKKKEKKEEKKLEKKKKTTKKKKQKKKKKK
jgi:hypothetical protein